MAEDVTVREASVDDVTAIQCVARAAWHATYDEILDSSTIDEQVDEWYRDDVVAEAVESEDVVYLVASDGDVVGYASAGPCEQGDDGEGEEIAQLYAIYVGPSYWGDGIGSRLLDGAIERLREDDYDALQMYVLEANDVGRSFYDSYGFPVIEEDTATIAGEEVDEVVYAGTL